MHRPKQLPWQHKSEKINQEKRNKKDNEREDWVDFSDANEMKKGSGPGGILRQQQG